MNVNWLDKHYSTMGYRNLGVQLTVIISILVAIGDGIYTRAGMTYIYSTIVMGILMAQTCYSLNRMIVYLKRLQGNKSYIPEKVANVKGEIGLQVLKYKVISILVLLIAATMSYGAKYGFGAESLDNIKYVASIAQGVIIVFLTISDPVNILDEIVEDDQS